MVHGIKRAHPSICSRSITSIVYTSVDMKRFRIFYFSEFNHCRAYMTRSDLRVALIYGAVMVTASINKQMEPEALDSFPVTESDEYTGSGSDEGSLCEEQIKKMGLGN